MKLEKCERRRWADCSDWLNIIIESKHDQTAAILKYDRFRAEIILGAQRSSNRKAGVEVNAKVVVAHSDGADNVPYPRAQCLSPAWIALTYDTCGRVNRNRREQCENPRLERELKIIHIERN